MPAPSRVTTNGTSTAQSASTSASLVVNYPSGSASGDLLVLCVGTYRNTAGTYTHTTPSGWTLAENNNQSGASDAKNYSIFYRFRGAETSVTLNFSVAVTSLAGIVAYQGATVDASNPINIDASSFDNSSSTGFTTPSATTTTGQVALLCWAFGIRAAATTYTFTWTSPATEVLDASVAMSGITAAHGISAGVDSQTAAGATGTRTATSSTAVLGRFTATLAIAGVPITASTQTDVTVSPTATAVRGALGDAPTTVTATPTATAQRTANASAPLEITAAATADAQRGQPASTSTTITVGASATAAVNYAAATALAVTAAPTAGAAWSGTAQAPLAITAATTADAFAGPVILADTLAVTVAPTAAVDRTTPASAQTDVTAAATATAARAATAGAPLAVTVGLTASASTPASAPLAVTVGLSAEAAVTRPIQAVPLVVTVTRTAAFAALFATNPTTITVTPTAAAVRTAAGVKTANGALVVTATATAAVTRNTPADTATTVTATTSATASASLHASTGRAVTVRTTATARVLGQPEPDTPRERVQAITTEDRSVVVTRESRTQAAVADPRRVVAYQLT